MLKEIRLLQSFTDVELGKLIQMGTGARYEAHSNIVIEGETSWGLYLILDGMVGIYKSNKMTGETYDVGQLRYGNFFGEMSLIDDAPRSATVRARTDATVVGYTVEAFRERLKKAAGFRFVPDPLPMRNSNKAVVYYLFFASQKPVAEEIIHDIFAKYR